ISRGQVVAGCSHATALLAGADGPPRRAGLPHSTGWRTRHAREAVSGDASDGPQQIPLEPGYRFGARGTALVWITLAPVWLVAAAWLLVAKRRPGRMTRVHTLASTSL